MRRTAAIGLVLALAMAGCGGGGDGGGRDEFYGVVTAEPLPGERELARLGRGKVGTLRINLAWGSVQSGPGVPYDWSHYDPVVRAAAENGIRVFATVYSSPIWAEPTPEHPPLGPSLRGFEAFARAAVERYGVDGAFWAESPELPELPITDWEPWNEPNRIEFWRSGPDPVQYLELLRAFSGAVRGADPEARVVLGSLFPSAGRGEGIPLEAYLSALYSAGAGELADAVGVHPYAATPQDALEKVAGAREVMNAFGDAGKPIWVTEIGWATGGVPSGVTVGPRRQATYLTEVFDLLADNRGRLGIAGTIWYSLRDVAGGDLWLNRSGLFGLDDSPKPSWAAFKELTGGTP